MKVFHCGGMHLLERVKLAFPRAYLKSLCLQETGNFMSKLRSMNGE